MNKQKDKTNAARKKRKNSVELSKIVYSNFTSGRYKLMKTYIKTSVIIASLLLASCVNQNTIISENLMPTTNACAKLSLLEKAYHNDFKDLKEIKVKGRVSNMWRAKYQLFGENCQVFTWGGDQHNYSCRLVAPDEESARTYYQNAKTITQECLGETWNLEESKRARDDGMKTTFTKRVTSEEEKVTFSTHLVSTPGVFSSTWTIYYYVGNSKPPQKNH